PGLAHVPEHLCVACHSGLIARRSRRACGLYLRGAVLPDEEGEIKRKTFKGDWPRTQASASLAGAWSVHSPQISSSFAARTRMGDEGTQCAPPWGDYSKRAGRAACPESPLRPLRDDLMFLLRHLAWIGLLVCGALVWSGCHGGSAPLQPV